MATEKSSKFMGFFPNPYMSEAFEAAMQILEMHSAETPGKRRHNQDHRILGGMILCGQCNSIMERASANKKK